MSLFGVFDPIIRVKGGDTLAGRKPGNDYTPRTAHAWLKG